MAHKKRSIEEKVIKYVWIVWAGSTTEIGRLQIYFLSSDLYIGITTAFKSPEARSLAQAQCD